MKCDCAEVVFEEGFEPGTDDPVNHPGHYRFANGVEVIDLTEQLNFNRGNVVKYVARAGRKDPSRALEDLKKAQFYLDREIAREESNDR